MDGRGRHPLVASGGELVSNRRGDAPSDGGRVQWRGGGGRVRKPATTQLQLMLAASRVGSAEWRRRPSCENGGEMMSRGVGRGRGRMTDRRLTAIKLVFCLLLRRKTQQHRGLLEDQGITCVAAGWVRCGRSNSWWLPCCQKPVERCRGRGCVVRLAVYLTCDGHRGNQKCGPRLQFY